MTKASAARATVRSFSRYLRKLRLSGHSRLAKLNYTSGQRSPRGMVRFKFSEKFAGSSRKPNLNELQWKLTTVPLAVWKFKRTE